MSTLSPAGRFSRSTRRVGSTATLAIIGLSLAFAAGPAASVTRTPYNTNLVKNPGFEAGAATSGYQPVAVPNWSTYGNMTVVKYGAPDGFPTLAEGARISGGKKFFTFGTPPGASTTCFVPSIQTFTIRGRGAAIDAGRVQIDFQAYLGTYDSQPDTAVAELYFYDSTGNAATGGFKFTATQTDGRMLLNTGRRLVPSGMRIVRIRLMSTDTQGYCDAYFDRISVKLSLV
ncbi:MAG TPA: hypothetical protein VEX62_12205 [Candidatus Limnocylindrales bacterium]|nr:hypothetical protein [Candidatus Limnocylindrales bacterium]